MFEFKQYRNKPLDVKIKKYHTNMTILWVFASIMVAAGAALVTWGTIDFLKDEQESVGEVLGEAMALAIIIIGSAIFVAGGLIVMIFAILFTRMYLYCKKQKVTQNSQVKQTKQPKQKKNKKNTN